jgi:hypothetical protein
MYIPELEPPPTQSLKGDSLSLAMMPSIRLPGISAGDAASQYIATGRSIEAERLANIMRSVYEISRRQNAATSKRAKARGRAAQRLAEKRTKLR